MKLILNFFLILLLINGFAYSQTKPKVSITMDDPNTTETPLLGWQQRNNKILVALKKHNLQAALFVCGKRINDSAGSVLLGKWNDAGHLICNHTFSHAYFHSAKINLQDFENDFLRCDSIINGYSNFTKLFRFPYLKEGDTREKRDGFRIFLDSLGYKHGYVTIDASDWYIDGRMIKALKENINTDIKPYKEYYMRHILDRARFYDSLAVLLTGREITHTILIHHSLLNALFLDDLLNMFEKNGWEVVNASDAFKDPVFSEKPDILPAGESLVLALAKQTGKYENILRYPGEDGDYEEANFNEFLKIYK